MTGMSNGIPADAMVEMRADADLVRLMGRGVNTDALRSRALACAIRIAREIEHDLGVVLMLGTVETLMGELAGDDDWTPPAGYTASTCPVCKARVMRSDRIPTSALASCTTCALKAGIAARGAR